MSQDPRFTKRRPEGDTHERLVCDSCGWIHYENPKVVVGAVASWEDGRLLLCRRAIEPRQGFWTIPAGFLELNETPEDGARREAWEEARARLTLDGLLAVYGLPRAGQVQLIYRARLASPDVAPGEESEETRLFAWEEIPWGDLAFPTVRWSLRHWSEVRGRDLFAPFTSPR